VTTEPLPAADLVGPSGTLFVDGALVPSARGATFAVTDPGNGEQIASVADGTTADGLAAVDAASTAAAGWAATPPRQRAEVLRRSFDLMIARRDELARLITLESGKALAEAEGEVTYAAEFLRWFSEEAVRGLGTFGELPNGNGRMITDLRPVGVSVFVTPWNFPAAMATRKIGPALAAGCTVVLKPAAETPLTALAMATVFKQAGVPDGVVNVVTTQQSSAVVGAMLEDPRVRKISFTGSTQVGRILLAKAAERVVRTSMELGGNAPFVVLDDADVDAAVASAMVAKLRNGGQSCTAANRFFVHRRVLDEFITKFADAMGKVAVGHGLTPGVELGSMIHDRAVADIGRIVDGTIEAGAELVTGGTAYQGPGAFFTPTILSGVPAGSPALAEEIFGPVAPIVAIDSDDEAIALANDTIFGLVGFVQSRDLGRALRVADRLEAGMIGINRGVVSDPAAPFGGWKESGVGREGAHDGLLEYLETKYIATSW
jgi:succinate-semialdehyde dehydrogenase / glutarate-semialdehyde dehydrogenase